MTSSARDAAFERHRLGQQKAWGRLTPIERLRWLDQAKEFAGKAVAAAEARRSQKTRA